MNPGQKLLVTTLLVVLISLIVFVSARLAAMLPALFERYRRRPCTMCTASVTGRRLTTLPCGHDHCRPCVRSNVAASMGDVFVPAQCCEPLPPSVIREACPKKEAQSYEARLEEFRDPAKLVCVCRSFLAAQPETSKRH